MYKSLTCLWISLTQSRRMVEMFEHFYCWRNCSVFQLIFFFTCRCMCVFRAVESSDVKSPRVLFSQHRGRAAPHLSNHSVYSPYVSYSHWAPARYLHWIRAPLVCCRLSGPRARVCCNFWRRGEFSSFVVLDSLTGMKVGVSLSNFSHKRVTSRVRGGFVV